MFSIIKKQENIFDNQNLFSVFRKLSLIVFFIFTYFLRDVLKIIIQTCKMIKNKTLDIENIFKTYLKLLKIG